MKKPDITEDVFAKFPNKPSYEQRDIFIRLQDEYINYLESKVKNINNDAVLLGVNLTRKLKREEQKDLLYTLFGFNLEDFEGDGHYVLYDEEGYEFFATNANCKFNFDTLGGIFGYAAHVAKDKGIFETKHEIRKVLGIRD